MHIKFLQNMVLKNWCTVNLTQLKEQKKVVKIKNWILMKKVSKRKTITHSLNTRESKNKTFINVRAC